jgi:hypothetical protein
MFRYTPSDPGWPVVLAIGLMGTFTVGLTSAGHSISTEILSWATSTHALTGPALPARPEVLVMTTNLEDQTRIDLAVNPRGYQVVVAKTAADATRILRADANWIGVVVVDANLPGTASIITLARTLAPKAKLIQLLPRHAASEVSKMLVDAI